MNKINQLPITYTPEDISKIFQLSKNTIYDLISRGEIVAKKIGNVYRIPSSSISFVHTGLDQDLYLMENQDRKNLSEIHKVLQDVRSQASIKNKKSK